MKVYISGQISGLSYEEAAAKFGKVENELIEQGYQVINPLKNGIPFNAPWELHIAMDIILLIGCDAIYLLPDWAYSKGATLEKSIAELTRKVLMYEETPMFLDIKQAVTEATGVSFFDIVGTSRERRHVYARMLYAQYCREKGASVVNIAKEMKHNHSTITYYIRKYKDDSKYNPEFKELIKLTENALSKN